MFNSRLQGATQFRFRPIYFCFYFFVCVLGTLYSLSADLNSGSYASPVQFVLFHDAWCSHSRQIYSTFKHVERWVDKSYHSPYCDVTLNAQDVKFLAVNVSETSVRSNGTHAHFALEGDTVAEPFVIRDVPSLPYTPLLRLYINGQPHAYTGGLSANHMVTWLLTKLKSPFCTLNNEITANHFFKNAPATALLVVLSVGANESLNERNRLLGSFSRAALFTEDVLFAYGPSSSFENSNRFCSPFSSFDSQIWFIRRDEKLFCLEFPLLRFRHPDGYKHLMALAAIKRLPPIVNMASYDRLDVMTLPLPKVILICDKDFTDYRLLVTRVYNTAKRYFPHIIFGISGVHSTLELRFLRLLSLDLFPTSPMIVVLLNNGTSYLFRDLVADTGDTKLAKFLYSTLVEGTTSPQVVSELECPSYARLLEQHEATGTTSTTQERYVMIKPITAKRFSTEILNNKTFVCVVLFYSSISKHDQQILQLFSSIARIRKGSHSTDIIFRTFDTIENDVSVAPPHPLNTLSLVFYTTANGMRKWTLYNGTFNENAILQQLNLLSVT